MTNRNRPTHFGGKSRYNGIMPKSTMSTERFEQRQAVESARTHIQRGLIVKTSKGYLTDNGLTPKQANAQVYPNHSTAKAKLREVHPEKIFGVEFLPAAEMSNG